MTLPALTVDKAQEILDGFHRVAVQDVSKHRWYTTQLVVYGWEGQLYGFYYYDPASELQEDQDRFEGDPVPVFPVVAREVITTVYAKAESG